MKQHEREFFICQVRSGKINIYINDKKLVIKPLTVDQSLESCEIFNKAYNDTYADGIMTEEEMQEWMMEQNLWTYQDEEKSKQFEKDIEKLKIEIYNARNDKKLREKIRLYLRVGEKQYASHLSKKQSYYSNTREGYASSEKLSWIIKNTTYYNDKLYDFSDVSINYIIEEWQGSFLTDSISRELARTEPWKSLWIIRNNSQTKLFLNEPKYELTYNQKNLIIWSQMYDNIQESPDCPTKEVIQDDDLLDGWFIIQAKKREKESLTNDFEKNVSSEKIKNASEVFVVSSDPDRLKSINELNDPIAKKIKKERLSVLQTKSEVEQHELPDEQLKIRMEYNNMYKRGR